MFSAAHGQQHMFARFDAATPIKVRTPPQGLGWCGECHGRGAVSSARFGDRRCQPCNGSGLAMLEAAAGEPVS